mmetsp:Transcript_4851/g.12286  ORF Transcript_4851/g.12286 Transcript_4851/m.12286 type:complete len:245 (-) Transcript_4851:3353-4087(-)
MRDVFGRVRNIRIWRDIFRCLHFLPLLWVVHPSVAACCGCTEAVVLCPAAPGIPGGQSPFRVSIDDCSKGGGSQATCAEASSYQEAAPRRDAPRPQYCCCHPAIPYDAGAYATSKHSREDAAYRHRSDGRVVHRRCLPAHDMLRPSGSSGLRDPMGSRALHQSSHGRGLRVQPCLGEAQLVVELVSHILTLGLRSSRATQVAKRQTHRVLCEFSRGQTRRLPRGQADRRLCALSGFELCRRSER